MKILHVINAIDFSDGARQLRILGPAANAFGSVEVCCFGPETPRLASLRRAGVVVHSLGWTRWFDPSVAFNLHAILREAAPEVIHVWGLSALRLVALVAAGSLSRAIVSGSVPAHRPLPWFDRRLLERVRFVAVTSESERRLWAGHGLEAHALQVVAPLIEEPKPDVAKVDTGLRIACVEGSYRHAVWSFDFVRMLYPDVVLQLADSGAECAKLAFLVNALDCAGAVEFCDNSAVLQGADLAWITSQNNRGRQSAVECMALGLPVIASDLPCLREVIEDGITGFLVAPGEVVQLARRTRMLLDDASLRAHLGNAARAMVEQRFPRQQAVEQWRELYRRVAA